MREENSALIAFVFCLNFENITSILNKTAMEIQLLEPCLVIAAFDVAALGLNATQSDIVYIWPIGESGLEI